MPLTYKQFVHNRSTINNNNNTFYVQCLLKQRHGHIKASADPRDQNVLKPHT